MKHASVWRNEFRKGLRSLAESRPAQAWCVYRGKEELVVEGTRVVPVESFLRRLHAGEVLAA